MADNASGLARKYGANEDLSRSAAMLHDIADCRMQRDNPEHEATSLQMARELMEEAGFSANDQKIVADDAIRYHSCHGDERPASVEGRILSTADSMAYLKSDFYVYATWALTKGGMSLTEIKRWVLKKIERDINNKMFFDDVRNGLMPDYKMIKTLYSR